MLDGQPAVVAVEAQPITKLPPPFLVVTISHGNIAPSAISHVLVSNGLQAAGQTEHRIIHQCILCVNMMNGIAQGVYSRKGVGTRPKKVTRVEICADDLSNRLSQFQQRRNVINELMPMQFNTKLCDTRVFGGRGKLCPVGQQFLVPLPLENLAVLQRPCARDPIWSNVRRPPGGDRTSGQRYLLWVLSSRRFFTWFFVRCGVVFAYQLGCR